VNHFDPFSEYKEGGREEKKCPREGSTKQYPPREQRRHEQEGITKKKTKTPPESERLKKKRIRKRDGGEKVWLGIPLRVF